MFGLSRHPLSRVCQHSNPASVTSHQSWSIPVSTHSNFAVLPHENVCQPSSLRSKLRSSKTRLSWLRTVIDGQESRRTLDKMSKLHRSRLDTSPLRLQYVPRHTALMTSVSTPSSASVQESLKHMSLLRDNDFTAKAMRDMIPKSRDGSLERRRRHHKQR